MQKYCKQVEITYTLINNSKNYRDLFLESLIYTAIDKIIHKNTPFKNKIKPIFNIY